MLLSASQFGCKRLALATLVAWVAAFHAPHFKVQGLPLPSWIRFRLKLALGRKSVLTAGGLWVPLPKCATCKGLGFAAHFLLDSGVDSPHFLVSSTSQFGSVACHSSHVLRV